MGTGSSRCSPPARRWRRSRWGSGSNSAASQQGGAEEQQRAADAGARCSPALAQSPLPPLGEPDSDSELLDQVLAECDADGPVQPRWRLAGQSSCSPAGGASKADQANGDCRQILLTSATPASENSNFTNLPLKKAEAKSKTSYDYSEEEMMAAIEQEYGR